MASINRESFRKYGGKILLVHLTYPARFPGDPDTWKAHLKAFKQRLERKFGNFSGYWRLGLQQRGAPHFHLVLFSSSLGARALKKLRSFVRRAWFYVVGSEDEAHLEAGTTVERARKWAQITSYAEKYLAKVEKLLDDLQAGKIWGAWRQNLLPVSMETVNVSLEDAFKIRRWLRRIASLKGYGALNSLTVFVPYSDIVRMLAWMGYIRGPSDSEHGLV